jgi:lysophospholipase L1-like esterase
MHLIDVLRKLTANERLARESMFEFFKENNISYVDALPAMQASAEHQLYARTAQDAHPGRNGYRVIAEAVAQALNQNKVVAGVP